MESLTCASRERSSDTKEARTPIVNLEASRIQYISSMFIVLCQQANIKFANGNEFKAFNVVTFPPTA